MSLIWIVNILSVFFLCVFFAGIVIPQILLIAFRRRLFDEPDERKIHQCVVPRLGGMAFKPVVFFSFVLLLAVNVSTGHDELLKEIGAEALPLAYAFCAIIMLYLVGIADDLIGVRYRAKFFIQIVCGIMLVAGGVELSDLHGMLFIHSMPSWISIPLTVFVTVFIINAINLIDGVDGLSSGFSIQAFICFAIINLVIGNQRLALLALLGIGALLPFFFHNVFGRTSKMFIGDGGTLVIGAIFATLVISLLSDDQLTFRLPERLGLIPFTLAVMCIPVFDTLRVMTSRIVRHKSPFSADKTHLHHLFIDLGFSHIGTTLCILALNLSVILIWWLSYSLGASIDVQFYIVLLLSISVTFLFYGFMRRQIKHQTALYRAARRLAGAIHLRRRPLFIFLQRLADGKGIKGRI